MKSIDDALELRGRILGAFEQAERSSDPARREKLLTFTVVGAGPDRRRDGRADRRTRRPHPQGRVPPHRLDPGAGDPARRGAARCCRRWARSSARRRRPGWRRWASRSSWARWSPTSTATASPSRIPTAPSGASSRPPRCGRPACRPARWAATSPTSPTWSSTAPDGSRCCPTCPFPATRTCSSSATWRPSKGCRAWRRARSRAPSTWRRRSRPNSRAPTPPQREPFEYFDKGSMATVSRFSAVAKVGPLEFGGFIAWLAWLVLHLVYLVGFKTKITTLLSWTVTFLCHRPRQAHHHRAAGVRANPDRRAGGDRGVRPGHRRKGGELEPLALPGRQAAFATPCEGQQRTKSPATRAECSAAAPGRGPPRGRCRR